MITAEISPPKGTDTSRMLRDAALLKDIADAVNVTDNQRAVMRMSPLAACSILQGNGFGNHYAHHLQGQEQACSPV